MGPGEGGGSIGVVLETVEAVVSYNLQGGFSRNKNGRQGIP